MGNFYYNLIGGLNTELTPIKLGADNSKVYWAQALNVEPYKNQGVTRQKGNQIIFDARQKIPAKNFSTDASDEAAGGDLSPVKIVGVAEYPKGGENFVLALCDGRVFYFDATTGALNCRWRGD